VKDLLHRKIESNPIAFFAARSGVWRILFEIHFQEKKGSIAILPSLE
jgi:hypothetical protein